MWLRHHAGVRVGVIDVGSNTVRLLVTRGDRTVLTEREMLHLGADVEIAFHSSRQPCGIRADPFPARSGDRDYARHAGL